MTKNNGTMVHFILHNDKLDKCVCVRVWPSTKAGVQTGLLE